MTILLQQALIQTSTINTDTNGDLLVFTDVYHCLDTIFSANILVLDPSALAMIRGRERKRENDD
jgi:hypothetical protein